jgi:hypothetical protein
MKDKSKRQLDWEEKHMKITIAMHESVVHIDKIKKDRKLKQQEQ